MTGFFDGKAVGQIDEVLINSIIYTDKEIKELIKKHLEKKNDNS